MKTKILLAFLISAAFISCHEAYEHKTVVCIPVYGQSLALGEEAVRITDFDSLSTYADGRIVTENLDHDYGYFDNDGLRQFAKKMIRYQKRSFELTVYSMAEMLADSLGNDTLICTFPGGKGTTDISHLGKGSLAYQNFLENIKTACDEAKERGWEFFVPALCWMQGESDVADYPETDYRKLLLQFFSDVNRDIKHITGQVHEVEFICYQTNPITRAKNFSPLSYDCRETEVPQTLLNLVRDYPLFHASGPTYPYDFVREHLHIDAKGQIQIGRLAALSALDILRGEKKRIGLVPLSYEVQGNDVLIHFNVPCPPLRLDTINVNKADNYGFNIIRKDNADIISSVCIDGNTIVLKCKESPVNCKIRYGINGDFHKGGRNRGPRGNLRDSQTPICNWCFLFEYDNK